MMEWNNIGLGMMKWKMMEWDIIEWNMMGMGHDRVGYDGWDIMAAWR